MRAAAVAHKLKTQTQRQAASQSASQSGRQAGWAAFHRPDVLLTSVAAQLAGCSPLLPLDGTLQLAPV